MELIKPLEIAGKIMTLFAEAKEFVIVISPYYKLNYWRKLNRIITDAKNKNISITFFVREGEYQSIQEIRNLGYEPIQIKNLHAKLYFNESEAVITSMNLNESSDANSLDIGLKTQTAEEYKSVFQFYEKYIAVKKEISANKFCELDDLMKQIDLTLNQFFSYKRYITLERNGLNVQCGSRYIAVIKNVNGNNQLHISCVISGNEFDYVEKNKGVFKKNKLSIELIKGERRNYSQILGVLPNLKSSTVEMLFECESKLVVDTIAGFINGIQQMKDVVYKLR